MKKNVSIMITSLKQYENNYIESQPDEMLNTSPPPDYFGFERIIVCLEAYFSANIFNDFTVKPYIQQLSWIVEEKIDVAHRFIDCGLGLRYYINVLMQDQIFAPVVYLAMHGKPYGNIEVSYETDINPEELCEAFKGFGTYPVLVYFSSCDLFRGEKGKEFAQEFLKISGAVAVAGYKKEVSFIDSLIIDTMFLSRFYTVQDPFGNLSQIYESVKKDYRLANDYSGFSLFLNGNHKIPNSAFEKQSVIKTSD